MLSTHHTPGLLSGHGCTQVRSSCRRRPLVYRDTPALAPCFICNKGEGVGLEESHGAGAQRGFPVLLSQTSHIGPKGSSDGRGCSGDPTVAAAQLCQVRFHSEAFALAVPPLAYSYPVFPVSSPHFISVSRST